MSEQVTVQWWLAEVDQHGIGRPVDGPHSARSGADKAMYLYNALGLSSAKRYVVARIELYEPKPSADGVNQEAVGEINRARTVLAASKRGAGTR